MPLCHCATVQRALSNCATVLQPYRAWRKTNPPPPPSLGGARPAPEENRTAIRRIAPCCGAPPRLPADRATISLSHYPEGAMLVGKKFWVQSSTLPQPSPASLWSALYDGPSLRSGLNDGTCLQTLANSSLGEVFDRAPADRRTGGSRGSDVAIDRLTGTGERLDHELGSAQR